MSDQDRFGLAKSEIEAKRKALEAELNASLQQANTPASINTSEAIAQGILGMLPMLLGGAIAGKRGMGAGAQSGHAASEQYGETVKEKGKLAQENARLQAKALLGQMTGLDKASTSLDIAGVKADAAGDLQGQRARDAKELEGTKQGNRFALMRESKATPQAKAEAPPMDEAIAYLRAKIAAKEPLSDEERQVAHSDKSLSDILVRAALTKAAGGDITEMGANIRAKIANGQTLEPEEERFAHTDKDLSKMLISAGLTRQNAEATQRARTEDAKELQGLRFEQSKELKGIPSAKAVEAPQTGEQARLRAKILTDAEMTPEDMASLAQYPGLAAELQKKRGQDSRLRANKETYQRKLNEREIPGAKFVAGFTPSDEDKTNVGGHLVARGQVDQYSKEYLNALKTGDIGAQSAALSNLIWAGKTMRQAGANFTESEQALIRAGLPAAGGIDWTYGGVKDYVTKTMQNTDNQAKLAAFVRNMNNEIDRYIIQNKYLPPGYTSQVVNVDGNPRSIVFKNGKYFQHFELQ